MLMVDQVTEMAARREGAIGIKNVSINEPFLPGTFPVRAGHAWRADHRGDGADGRGAVVATFGGEVRGQAGLLHVDRRRAVSPAGACRATASSCMRRRSRAAATSWKFDGKAIVDGKVAAQATFAAMIRDK